MGQTGKSLFLADSAPSQTAADTFLLFLLLYGEVGLNSACPLLNIVVHRHVVVLHAQHQQHLNQSFEASLLEHLHPKCLYFLDVLDGSLPELILFLTLVLY